MIQNVDTKTEILGEILELPGKYSEPNWDGYGACPVSPNSIAFAWGFVESVPSWKYRIKPEVGVDGDGFVVLDWYENPGSQCDVTFSDDFRGVYLNAISCDLNAEASVSDGDFRKIVEFVMKYGFIADTKTSDK